MKKTAAKKAAKKATPRAASRQVGLADARKAAQVRTEEAAALLEGDELPLVVVRGRKRPQARVQLGDGGKVYVVTKPKDDLYLPMLDRMTELQGLVWTDLRPEDLTPEQTASLASAMDLMKEFITCAFAKEDRPEVLAHLDDPDTDEQRDDLAAAINDLMKRVWAQPASEA